MRLSRPMTNANLHLLILRSKFDKRVKNRPQPRNTASRRTRTEGSLNSPMLHILGVIVIILDFSSQEWRKNASKCGGLRGLNISLDINNLDEVVAYYYCTPAKS